MNALFGKIGLVLGVFTLLSLCIYRSHVNRTMPRLRQPDNGPAARLEIKTAEGEISAIDADGQTLTLTDGTASVVISFDDATAASQSGRLVRPAAIRSGSKATVKYVEKGGRYVARSIALEPDPYGGSY